MKRIHSLTMDANTTNAGQEIFDSEKREDVPEQPMDESALDALEEQNEEEQPEGQAADQSDADEGAVESCEEVSSVEGESSDQETHLEEGVLPQCLTIDTLAAAQGIEHGEREDEEQPELHSAWSDSSSDYSGGEAVEDESAEDDETKGETAEEEQTGVEADKVEEDSSPSDAQFPGIDGSYIEVIEKHPLEEEKPEEEKPEEEKPKSPRSEARLAAEKKRGYDYYDSVHRPKSPKVFCDEEPINVILRVGDERSMNRKKLEAKHRHGHGGRRKGNPYRLDDMVVGLGEDEPVFPSPLREVGWPGEEDGEQTPEQEEWEEWEDEDLNSADGANSASENEAPRRPPSRLDFNSDTSESEPPSEQTRKLDWAIDEDEDTFDLLEDAKQRFAQTDSNEEARRASVTVSVTEIGVDAGDDVSSTPETAEEQASEEEESDEESLEKVRSLDDEAPTSPGAQPDEHSDENSASVDITPDSPSSVKMLEVVTGMTEQEGVELVKAWSDRLDSNEPPLSPHESLAMKRAFLAWERESRARDNEAAGRRQDEARIPAPTDDEHYHKLLSGMAWGYRRHFQDAYGRYQDVYEYGDRYAVAYRALHEKYENLEDQYGGLRAKFNEIHDEYENSQRRLAQMDCDLQAAHFEIEAEAEKYNDLEKLYREQLKKCSECPAQDEHVKKDLEDFEAVAGGQSCDGKCIRLERQLTEQEKKTRQAQDEKSTMEREYQAALEANKDLEKKLHAARATYEKNLETYKAYAENNAALAEKQRQKEEEQRYAIPLGYPASGIFADMTDRASYKDADTQTADGEATAISLEEYMDTPNITSAFKQFLPWTTDWERASGIAKYIFNWLTLAKNHYYFNEQAATAMTEQMVLRVLEQSNTLERTVFALKKLGLIFRPDHLALHLEKWYTERAIVAPAAVQFAAQRYIKEPVASAQQLLTEVIRLQKQWEDAKTALQRKDTEHSELQTAYGEAYRNYRAMQKQATVAQATISFLKKQLEDKQTVVTDTAAQAEIEQLKKKLEEKEKELENVWKSCNADHEELGRNAETIAALTTENAQLQAKSTQQEADLTSLSTYHQSIAAEKERSADLEAENEELRRQLSEVQDRKASVEGREIRSTALLNKLYQSPEVRKALSGASDEDEDKDKPAPESSSHVDSPLERHNTTSPTSSRTGLRISTDPFYSPPSPLPPRTPAPVTMGSAAVQTPRTAPAFPLINIPNSRMSQWRNTAAYQSAMAVAQTSKSQDVEMRMALANAYRRVHGKERSVWDSRSPNRADLLARCQKLGMGMGKPRVAMVGAC